MDDINNYLLNIVLPVTVLLPQKIGKCTQNDADDLCATFPVDLKDPDALLAELEMMGNATTLKRVVPRIYEMRQSAYSEDNVFTQTLLKLTNWH